MAKKTVNKTEAPKLVTNRYERWPLEQIIPYANNPRSNDHAVPAVKASILQFGIQNPLLAEEDGSLVAGHTRLRAIGEIMQDPDPDTQARWKEISPDNLIPVLVAVGMSKADADAYRLIDNKSGELAVWNDELLAIEVNRLSADFDFSDFGFDAKTLENLSARSGDLNFVYEEEADAETPDDDEAEDDITTVTTSPIKQYMLLFNKDSYAAFAKMVEGLQSQLGTENESDTVYNVVKNAYVAATSK